MSQIKIAATINFLRIFISLGIGIFISPYILSSLGKSEYGIYTLVGTVISWLAMCDFGLTESTTKFICEYRAKNDVEGEAHYLGNITVLFAIIGVIILLIGFFIYPFLDLIFPKLTTEELGLFKILYLMTLVNTAVMFPSRSLSGISESRQRFIVPRLVSTLTTLFTSILTVLLLSLGYKSIALTTISISMGIINMLWNIYYCFGILNAKMCWMGLDFKLCRTMFSFSLWMFLGHIITILNWGSGNLIIGMTQGAAEISVYSYGLQIMNFYFLAASCISNLFLPRVVQIVSTNNNSEVLTSIWIKVGRIHVIILGLLLSGLLVFGKQFMFLWVGNTLGEASDTSWHVALLLVLGVTMPLIQCLGWQIMQARNAIHLRVKALLIVALLGICLGYVLSFQYGAIGLAIGTTLSLLIGQGFVLNFLYQYKVNLNVPRFFKETFSSIWGIVLISAAAFIIISNVENISWYSFVPMVAGYSFIYFLIVINTYMNKEECNMVPKVFRVFRFKSQNT